MAEIITGGAHSAYNNNTAGDQKQGNNWGPDFSGEVSMRRFSNVDAFKSHYTGYWVYRFKNPVQANRVAAIMKTACNNPNIGYSQGTRTGIFTYGENTLIPCNCDCSSLVSYCIQAGTGYEIGINTTSTLGNKMKQSGLFYADFFIQQISSDNPPVTGDILLKSGSHVELVVSGAAAGSGYSVDSVIDFNQSQYDSSSFPMQDYLTLNSNLLNSFTPRTREPQQGEEAYKYYKQTFGVNKNGSYAWGRFSEILGMACTISEGPVRRWYLMTEDGYERGLAPQLGAVMCYTNVVNNQDNGFACVVEYAGSDFVAVSMVNPYTNEFEYTKINKKSGSWNIDIDGDGTKEYSFQGFIYNPNVQTGYTNASKLTDFVETAKNQIGDDGSFTKGYTGIEIQTAAWSASFINAVAKKVGGLLDVIIPDTHSCTSIGSEGIKRSMGEWLDGPIHGGRPYPQAGDIALFQTSDHKGSTYQYEADKAAIVISVDKASAKTEDSTNINDVVSFQYVMGDSSSKVESKTALSTTPSLAGIFRPDWNRVDSFTQASRNNYNLLRFYAQGASLEDALIKDYKYISPQDYGAKPSIKSNGLMLCAINYSGVLGNIYNIFATMTSSNSKNPTSITDIFNTSSRSSYELTAFDDINVLGESAFAEIDISALNGKINSSGSIEMGNGKLTLDNNLKQIYKYLSDLFSNPAGAVGFMANMWAESGFKTNAKNPGSSASGLCQWLGGRRDNMVSHCKNVNGMSWENNLTGQLDYLKQELQSSYKSTLSSCKSCSLSVQGAKVAADVVCRKFEVPVVNNEPKMASISKTRQGYAEKIWTLLFGGLKA